MAIGTPVLLGNNSKSLGASDSIVISTTATHSAGERIVVAVAMRGNRTAGSCSDSAGNTYTLDVDASAGTGSGDARVCVYRSDAANALAAGGTITIASSGTAGDGEAVAACVSGCLTGTDASGSGTGSGTSPSGALTTVAASTITWSAMALAKPGLGLVMYTEDSDYTTLFSGAAPTLQAEVTLAYRIRGTAGGDTYAPTLDTSLTWGVGLDAFPGSTAGLGARCDGLLPVLGVGG